MFSGTTDPGGALRLSTQGVVQLKPQRRTRIRNPSPSRSPPRLRYACHLVVDVTVTTRTVRHHGAVTTACRCGILVEVVEVVCEEWRRRQAGAGLRCMRLPDHC